LTHLFVTTVVYLGLGQTTAYYWDRALTKSRRTK